MGDLPLFGMPGTELPQYYPPKPRKLIDMIPPSVVTNPPSPISPSNHIVTPGVAELYGQFAPQFSGKPSERTSSLPAKPLPTKRTSSLKNRKPAIKKTMVKYKSR